MSLATVYNSGSKQLSANSIGIGTTITRTTGLDIEGDLLTKRAFVGVSTGTRVLETPEIVLRYNTVGVGTATIINTETSGTNIWVNSSYNTSNPGTGWTRTLTISPYGNVGIGNINPITPLDVVGSSMNYLTTGGYLIPTGAGGNYTWNGYYAISIKASSRIWSQDSYVASSDYRIKTNIQDINDDQALKHLRQLQPKTYEYIDKVARGSNIVYGFIAQEVADVIPYAVSQQVEFIPNIFTIGTITQISSNIYEVCVPKEHELIPSDIIRIISMDNKMLEVPIVEVYGASNFTFQSENITDLSKIFIYGKKVDDFHVLNKDALWTISTAALQEIDRQNILLQERVDALEKRLSQAGI